MFLLFLGRGKGRKYINGICSCQDGEEPLHSTGAKSSKPEASKWCCVSRHFENGYPDSGTKARACGNLVFRRSRWISLEEFSSPSCLPPCFHRQPGLRLVFIASLSSTLFSSPACLPPCFHRQPGFRLVFIASLASALFSSLACLPP